MPQTQEQQLAFLQAVDAAAKDGHLSEASRGVWVGAGYAADRDAWEWNDGTPILGMAWGEGQPSARGHQQDEPWLCITNNQVQDAPSMFQGAPVRFAVLCEVGAEIATEENPLSAAVEALMRKDILPTSLRDMSANSVAAMGLAAASLSVAMTLVSVGVLRWRSRRTEPSAEASVYEQVARQALVGDSVA